MHFLCFFISSYVCLMSCYNLHPRCDDMAERLASVAGILQSASETDFEMMDPAVLAEYVAQALQIAQGGTKASTSGAKRRQRRRYDFLYLLCFFLLYLDIFCCYIYILLYLRFFLCLIVASHSFFVIRVITAPNNESYNTYPTGDLRPQLKMICKCERRVHC